MLKCVFWLPVVGLLAACGGPTYAPVSERAVPGEVRASATNYIVKRGDTLYSIAFRYGLDYRQLAELNSIDRRYNIYPGQRLKLKSTKRTTQQESIIRDSSIVASQPIITSTREIPKASSSGSSTVTKPAVKQSIKSVIAKPVVATKVPSTPSPQKKSTQKTAAKANVSRKNTANSQGKIYWKWPAVGKIINKFKTSGGVNKGIDIAGSMGDEVHAAASGKVVYAGSGLLGYGNLVIIDHNQRFLSAYAHNSRVLVKENDMVKAGQKIAEMGRSGTDRVMLHFEIRRDGKPVDPLRYLSKR